MTAFFKQETVEEELTDLESDVKTALRTIGRNKSPDIWGVNRAIPSHRNRVYSDLNKSMPTNSKTKQ